MIGKAAAFLKDVRNEMSQVSWATRRELWDSTKVVIVTMILLSSIIALFDFVCAHLISWMVR